MFELNLEEEKFYFAITSKRPNVASNSANLNEDIATKKPGSNVAVSTQLDIVVEI